MADNSENDDLKRRSEDSERDKENKRLKLLLELKDRQLEQKDRQHEQQLEQKDRQLKKNERQLKKKDRQLNLKDRQLDLKSRQHEQQLKKNERQLQRKDDENIKLLLNYSIKGLWEGQQTNFEIVKRGTPSQPHVDYKRLAATAVPAAFSLLTARLEPNTLAKPSSLLAAFNRAVGERRKVLTFENEADVQIYVHAALMDAITIMNDLIGLQEDEDLLTARRESSIFSNKPDHVVVCFGALRTPVLVVETKQPVTNLNKIHRKVWGQIFDYQGIMRVVGRNSPFVVLSTFEQSWVTWAQHNEKCAKIAIATDYNVRYTQPLEQLKRHFSRELKKHFSLKLSSVTPSPCQLNEAPLVQYSVTARRRKDDGSQRQLSTSRTFQSKDLVNLFVNAIVCSLSNFHGTSSIVRNEVGYELTNKHVMTMTTTDYCFETISLKVLPGEFRSNRFSSQASNGFHILDVLGSGRTSKAFLAATTKGHECVLKMYVRKFDEGNNYQPIPENQITRDATDRTKKEQKMYKKIYSMDIPIIQLFDHTCLVLPYFRPVQKDERRDALIALEVLLREKFRVGMGRATKYYKFREDEQNWRHCGYTGMNEEKVLFVYDLAELEECATEEAHERYIKEHIASLSKSLTASAPPAGQSA